MAECLKEYKIDNRFLMGHKIGHGSFGEVYLCTDLETDQFYAIKLEDQ